MIANLKQDTNEPIKANMYKTMLMVQQIIDTILPQMVATNTENSDTDSCKK